MDLFESEQTPSSASRLSLNFTRVLCMLCFYYVCLSLARFTLCLSQTFLCFSRLVYFFNYTTHKARSTMLVALKASSFYLVTFLVPMDSVEFGLTF